MQKHTFAIHRSGGKTKISCTKTFVCCTPLSSHRVVVLAEGEDLGVVPERLAQSQLGDGLHGQPQQVGTQRGVLSLRGGRPLPHQLLHQL